MRTLLLLALLLAAPSWGQAPDAGHRGLGSALNLPQDTDADSDPDFILCGDYDADGTKEMADVQACYDSLTDTTARHLHVLSGTYLPGTAGTSGQLEIDGDTGAKITCEPGAALTNYGFTDTDASRSIIWVNDSTDVTISDCELDGRMPDTYDSSGITNKFRIGIKVADSTRVRVRNLYIHNVQSIAVLINGGFDTTITNNLAERVGGFGDTAGAASVNAGFEFYTDSDGDTVDRFVMSNNTCRYCGSAAYSVRRGRLQDRIRNGVIEGNLAERPRTNCFYQGGADSILWNGNTCFGAPNSGLDFEGTPTGYSDTALAASSGVTFENNVILGSDEDASGAAAINIKARQTDLHLLNNTLDGYVLGVNITPPQRGLLIDGLVAKNGKSYAIQDVGVSGAYKDEEITIRNVLVENTDGDSISHPLYLGAFTFAGKPTCDESNNGGWIAITDAADATDCTVGPDASPQINRCTCLSGVWTERTTANIATGSNAIRVYAGKGFKLSNVIIRDSSTDALRFEAGSTADYTGMVVDNVLIEGPQWGYLGEITEATAAAMNCGGTDADGDQSDAGDGIASMEGKWAYITDGAADCIMGGAGGAGNICMCQSGATQDTWTDWDPAVTAVNGIYTETMTGDGPSFTNIKCRNLTSNGSCVKLLGGVSMTAINGRIEAEASYRTTAQAASTKTNYAVEITDDIADGWIINASCANTENVICVDNLAATTAGAVVHSEGATGAAPAAELCDDAQEYGGTWQDHSGADNAVGYVCDSGGWDPFD